MAVEAVEAAGDIRPAAMSKTTRPAATASGKIVYVFLSLSSGCAVLIVLQRVPVAVLCPSSS
jgi:hypothetical protein